MTRRKFVLSLLGSVGSVVVGFGILDYVNNMKKMFESDYFENGRFRNKKPAHIMNEGTRLDTAKRWLFDKNDTSPKKESKPISSQTWAITLRRLFYGEFTMVGSLGIHIGVHGFKGSGVQGSILVPGLHLGCVFSRKASASSGLIQNCELISS